MDVQATAEIPRAFAQAQLEAEPRLQRRYDGLVMSHLSHAHRVAAGMRAPASLARPFAAVQGAWRFYANPQLTLKQLAGPLLQCAAEDVPQLCEQWVLVAMDWCNLHLKGHEAKSDRVELAHSKDLGYELLTALAISDTAGQPIAPLCLELRACDGVHSTRQQHPLEACSSLDGLKPVMQHVQGMKLGKTPVFVIDREADSVGHYRQWDPAKLLFVVRANDRPQVLHELKQRELAEVADELKAQNRFAYAGEVLYQGHSARAYVAETTVVLQRDAWKHRRDKTSGKMTSRKLKGEALPLRLVVSEIRDGEQRVLARWLLLSNLPESVPGAQVALWYYWRWRIESYHKLLKGAGQQVECWQQESAEAMSRRLLVAAMAGVVVWRLAREQGEEAAEMREVLVRLSGRQMKRGKPFTEPALLAGLGVLVPMLELLERYTAEELRKLTEAVLPGLLSSSRSSGNMGTRPRSGRPRRAAG